MRLLMLVIQCSHVSRLQLLLLGVGRVVVTSAPSWVHLHVEFLLLARHLVVLGLLRPIQRMPLKDTPQVKVKGSV